MMITPGECGQHAHLAAADPQHVAVDLVADCALVPRRDLMGAGAPPTVWAAVFVDGFVDFSTGVVTRPPPPLRLPLQQPRCRP